MDGATIVPTMQTQRLLKVVEIFAQDYWTLLPAIYERYCPANSERGRDQAQTIHTNKRF